MPCPYFVTATVLRKIEWRTVWRWENFDANFRRNTECQRQTDRQTNGRNYYVTVAGAFINDAFINECGLAKKAVNLLINITLLSFIIVTRVANPRIIRRNLKWTWTSPRVAKTDEVPRRHRAVCQRRLSKINVSFEPRFSTSWCRYTIVISTFIPVSIKLANRHKSTVDIIAAHNLHVYLNKKKLKQLHCVSKTSPFSFV